MFEMGMEGLEPTRLAAHDSKSCASASSATSPANGDYTTGKRFAKQAFENDERGTMNGERGTRKRPFPPLPHYPFHNSTIQPLIISHGRYHRQSWHGLKARP